MTTVGIILPDLLGIANFRPLIFDKVEKFTDIGTQYIYSDICPQNKVWYITYTLIGYSSGDISAPLLEIVDSENNRQQLLGGWRDLEESVTVHSFSPYWVKPGNRVRVKYSVIQTITYCFLSLNGFEINWTGCD